MNSLQVRVDAAVKVQAACRSFLTRKRLERQREAATTIQRRFRRRKSLATATQALENARRRRRIRKHELESKYLKTLRPDMFEKYKRKQRAHAAVVIQRAWRNKHHSQRQKQERDAFEGGRGSKGPSLGQPSSSNTSMNTNTHKNGNPSLDHDADEVDELYQSDLKGVGQTNSTEYWGLLSQEKKKVLLDQIRRKAERVSEYDKVYTRERDDDASVKKLLQECYGSLARFSALQRAKSRLSKKTALLCNQLVIHQSTTNQSLEDVATSAEIEGLSALPPLPTGKRLERAKEEHETCLKAVKQLDRNSNSYPRQLLLHFSEGKLGNGSYKQKTKDDINMSLERHNQSLHETEAQVAQDWSEVKDLVNTARRITTSAAAAHSLA